MSEDEREAGHRRLIQARRALSRSAWREFEAGEAQRRAGFTSMTAEQWRDCVAPQWALDALSEADVRHLMAYVWGES